MDATNLDDEQADPLLKERAWISAFADGESTASPANWARLIGAEEAKRTWHDYHLVGDLIRAADVKPVRPVFARKVMLALDQQPTVLAPPKKSKFVFDFTRQWGVPGAAIAAATAAVVWVAMPQLGGSGGSMTATVPQPAVQARGAPAGPVAVPPGVTIMPASVSAPDAGGVRAKPVAPVETGSTK